jgi:hypothetical protein
VRTRLAIGGATAVAAAALVAAVLVLRGGEGGPARGEAVVASTSVSPRLPAFGDRVTAELRVKVDRRQADPSSVRVTARFAPYRPLGRPARSKSGSGETTVLRYRYVLDCLERACLPRGKLFLFPRARVTYGGGEVAAAWPEFLVVARTQPADLRQPQMRDGLRPLPRISYRTSPAGLELAFGGGAVLLVLLAAGLVAHSRPRPAPAAVQETNGALSPLEAALALVRQAASAGDPVMQRKALERLASELRRARLLRLARSARRLAWSERKPQTATTGAFADEVVRAVEARG